MLGLQRKEAFFITYLNILPEKSLTQRLNTVLNYLLWIPTALTIIRHKIDKQVNGGKGQPSKSNLVKKQKDSLGQLVNAKLYHLNMAELFAHRETCHKLQKV